jgi:starch synthase
MKVLLAASEVVPFAKTGGLADVAGSLPRALAHRGHECAVLLPLYRSVRTGRIPIADTGHRLAVPVGGRLVAGGIWQARLPNSGVPVFLIEEVGYFERDDPARGRGLYQFTLPDGQKRDYPDNSERFVFFCRAILEAMNALDWWPDILHVNDWQTGLAPVYLNEVYRRHSDPVLRSRYEQVRTLFTLHNLAYQGVFWHLDMPLTGLDWRLFNHHHLEFYGNLNFLKGGIVFADLLNTVSPTYAREIQTPAHGHGLEGALAERRDRLFGIVNGVDYSVWNPARDPHIPGRYDVETVAEGKARCKAALQRRHQLPERPHTPLVGMIARLVDQKGLSLVGQVGDWLLQQDVQFVVLGEGDEHYHRMLRDLQARFPGRMGLTLAFDEPLAHQIEAGADLFLMPSQYEPAGLNQLYSLKYGTVPVVRATGGLADTVTDCTPETLAEGTATGFGFEPYTPTGLHGALERALDAYRNQPELWARLLRTGMQQDWSWERSAAEYEKLYERLKGM